MVTIRKKKRQEDLTDPRRRPELGLLETEARARGVERGRRFSIGEETFATRKEFEAAKRARGITRQKESLISPKVKAQELLEARAPPVEQPVPEAQPVEQPAQPQQEFGTDVVTGERVPLLSGEVSSAQPLIEDIALFAGGGGLIPKGVKLAAAGRGLTLPISAKGAAIAAGQKKVAGGLKTLTAGLASKAIKTTGGVLVAVFGVSKLIGQPVSRLQSIDTALGQIRETITAPVAGVRNGAFSPAEGLDQLDDLEDAISEYEKSLHALEKKVFLTTINREKMDSAKIRLRKLRTFIDVGRQDIALVAVSGGGQLPDSELIAIMLRDLE